MNISPGARIGPYEIVAPLGRGGMGEVWRARDPRLGREVALKFLPADFADDPERHARFEREAKLLASLNHPNIAVLYGLEHVDGQHALAMELVEGEGLDERIGRGPAPAEEALPVALQIAEALEAAHEKGIVHRDLKPANVRIRRDGAVKVLDFGLAKTWEEQAGESDLAHSPTITAHHTRAGVILGTAAYMSPEQARGKAVDKRTDIWAFGVVVFEMLTGRKAFEGETVTDTLAAVLTREVDWSRLPPSTPPVLRALLRRCLARSTKDRMHDIADTRIVLAELERGGGEEGGDGAAVASGSTPVSAARRLAVAAALLLGALLGGVGARLLPAAGPRHPTFRLMTSESGFIHSGRFAPDGTTIVYGEARGGEPVSLHSTRSDAMVSRALDLPSADVVGIAADGRMALILDRHHVGSWLRMGTLAESNIAGGAARSLLEGIYDADIAGDGSAFAIVRYAGPQQQLEYPIGTVLYRTSGWISSPRIARDRSRIAFADHPIPGDDQGYVAVAEAGGKVKRLSEALNFLHGVAWSADGREVFASFGAANQGSFIDAFSLSGSSRRVLDEVALVRLHDVAPNGELLVTSDYFPVAAEGRLAGGVKSGDFATWTGDTIDGISDDGTVFAGTTGGFLSAGEYRTFYRRVDSPSAVALGEGTASGITPDGRWVFVTTVSRDRSRLRAVPTGAGEARTFDLRGVEPSVGGLDHVTCSSDGHRVAFAGVAGAGLPRGYVFDLDGGGPPRAVTPEGVQSVVLSPNGRALAAVGADGIVSCYDAGDGSRRAVPGAVAGEIPVAWASSDDAIFVWNRTFPARVQRLELATGRRETAFEWRTSDPSGVLYGLMTATPDVRYFLVRYRRGLSSLAVVDGVR